MSDSFNVFVIGPMGKDKDIPSESGTPISQHMANIAAALRTILPRYIKAPDIPHVYSPLEGAADIVEFVFTQIDDADLAVADITSRSPSVMYELAYFHALDTPLIVIDDNNVSSSTTPFYLKGINILRVSSFDVETLTSAINERLQRFFDQDDFQNFSTNPISNFYGAPLIEISGAATIARGYYQNFMRGIIDSHSGVAAPTNSVKETPVEKLYIIKPSAALNAFGDSKLFGEVFGDREDQTFITGAGKRIVKYDGRAIFDLPRTIYTLAHSPRIQRLEAAMNMMKGISEERKKQMRVRALKGLVDMFYGAIEKSIVSDPQIFREMVEFIDISELSAIVR